MLRPRHLGICAATAALVFGAAGCFNPFDPRISVLHVASAPAPVPNSPDNAVRLFAWCWAHRDPAQYAEVFTDDYRFIFAPNDSAGNAYRDRPWLREDEMQLAQHLFVGGSDQPPASDIEIIIDNSLLASPDPRVGFENFRLFKTIRTNVSLKVTVDRNGAPDVSVITGTALFYLVRGDTAAIPQELKLKGFAKDSLRWWISRWEDETAGAVSGSPASLRPGLPLVGVRPAATYRSFDRTLSWGQLKSWYLPNATY